MIYNQFTNSTIQNKKKNIIEIKDLKKSHGDNHNLNGFNMTLYEGENLVIMGNCGSGKLVMIKCLITQKAQDSGSISVMGKQNQAFPNSKHIR
jgi:phospholipid/cholesterol/gamma-HCH transport system ATP-binding protein